MHKSTSLSALIPEPLVLLPRLRPFIIADP